MSVYIEMLPAGWPCEKKRKRKKKMIVYMKMLPAGWQCETVFFFLVLHTDNHFFLFFLTVFCFLVLHMHNHFFSFFPYLIASDSSCLHSSFFFWLFFCFFFFFFGSVVILFDEFDFSFFLGSILCKSSKQNVHWLKIKIYVEILSKIYLKGYCLFYFVLTPKWSRWIGIWKPLWMKTAKWNHY